MQDIKFVKPVAYRGKKWGRATGIGVMSRDTMEYDPSTTPTKVVALTPNNSKGCSNCEVEVPVEKVEDFVMAVLKAANIDPAIFAKQLLTDDDESDIEYLRSIGK